MSARDERAALIRALEARVARDPDAPDLWVRWASSAVAISEGVKCSVAASFPICGPEIDVVWAEFANAGSDALVP